MDLIHKSHRSTRRIKRNRKNRKSRRSRRGRKSRRSRRSRTPYLRTPTLTVSRRFWGEGSKPHLSKLVLTHTKVRKNGWHFVP